MSGRVDKTVSEVAARKQEQRQPTKGVTANKGVMARRQEPRRLIKVSRHEDTSVSEVTARSDF